MTCPGHMDIVQMLGHDPRAQQANKGPGFVLLLPTPFNHFLYSFFENDRKLVC